MFLEENIDFNSLIKVLKLNGHTNGFLTRYIISLFDRLSIEEQKGAPFA